MTGSEPNESDPDVEVIEVPLSESLLETVEDARREREFDDRDEFVRYALRSAAKHPEGAAFWRDLAIGEAQFAADEGRSSDEVRRSCGLDEQ